MTLNLNMKKGETPSRGKDIPCIFFLTPDFSFGLQLVSAFRAPAEPEYKTLRLS